MDKNKRRIIHTVPGRNDRRLYVNRNLVNGLFYFNACGISYPNKDFFITKHFDKHYTVQYIMSGSGFITYEGQRYEMKAGDMFYLLAAPGISYGTNPDDPFTKIWMNGSGTFWEMSFRAFGFEAPFGIISTDDRVIEYFHKAFDVAEESEENRVAGMTALTAILNVMYDYKNGNLTVGEAGKSISDMATEIKRYIDIYLTTVKDISEIAGRFDISARTVYSKFRNAYGVTPSEYITENRLELAKELLSDLTVSVADVSERSGFSSASYFCKQFSKKYGISPQKYRKNQKT